MLGPHGLAPLALAQLAAWQEAAISWPLRLNEADGHLRCKCGRSVVPLTDRDGVAYAVTPRLVTDSVVRHLRESHPEEEPPGL